MENYKCAFSGTLMRGGFGCAKAQHVVRRAGPDIACESQEAHARCAELFQHMKAAALPAFGVEDDLLSMPHSVLVKIQFGGLLGLQRQGNDAGRNSDTVKNIQALVNQTLQKHGNLDAIAYSTLVENMTSYKLKRRG